MCIDITFVFKILWCKIQSHLPDHHTASADDPLFCLATASRILKRLCGVCDQCSSLILISCLVDTVFNLLYLDVESTVCFFARSLFFFDDCFCEFV